MKYAEIEVGKTYTDGKGAFREVTGAGHQFRIYAKQDDTDCLEYRAWATRRAGIQVKQSAPSPWMRPRQSPQHHHITRVSFAAWAKREATADEVAALP